MSLRNQLKGTGTALVTPFRADESIDFPALEKLINFQIGNGVEYLVSLGTTGEAPVLSKEEKRDLILFTLEKAAGRVPVLAGVGGNNTQELVHDLQYLPLEGITAVLSASPYYSKPSPEGIFQHYKTLAAASPRPIILYNVPGRTAKNMSAALTLRLASEVPNIAGIKEASGDMAQCMLILRDRPADFLVVSGDDNLALPQIACGMDGIISVASNCFPGQFSEMVRQSLAGQFPAAKLLNDRLMAGYELLFAENNPAGVKAFLAEMGIIENALRLPLVPLSAELHEKVRAFLAAQ